MSSDRRAILGLIAMGRITPVEAERLLAAWNEGRETAWLIVLGLMFALMAQIHLHELIAMLMHFVNAQAPAVAEILHHTRSLV